MFNWNKFPYTNFHELNLDWFIKKFQEIFDQWATLYQTMLEWKADTDQDLADWKRDTLAALDQWEDDLIDALDLWKQATGQDITDWEDGVIQDLNSWKSTFEDDYEALATRVQAIVSDVEDMVENLAQPFSTSTAYVTGDYVVQNGILYRFTADHPAGAWTGTDAQQVTAMREIDDLAADDYYNQVFTNSGVLQLTSDMFENGIWYRGAKQVNANRGRMKRLIPVKKGMRVNITVSDFDVFWGVVDTRPWTTYAQGGSNGTWITAIGTSAVSITVDGWLVIMIRNHGADSTPVDCSTFSQDVNVETSLEKTYLRNDTAFIPRGVIANNTNFNDILNPGSYTTQTGYTYPNCPYPAAGYGGMLLVFKATANVTTQIAYQHSFLYPYGRKLFVRMRISSSWSGWEEINKEYILKSTGDTTDRTAEVEALLDAFGYVKFDSGVFYLNEITLAAGMDVSGMGSATILRSINTNYGSVFDLADGCRIHDLTFIGDDNNARVSSATDRNAINFVSTYIYQQQEGGIDKCMLYNIRIDNFSGSGIKLSHTGPDISCHCLISNVQISGCSIGINIDYSSEFHRISNCAIQRCWYGVINNGGNNNFSNCDFSGNMFGVYMNDSPHGAAINNSHGTFSACSFNHSRSEEQIPNEGVAIKMYGLDYGEMFTGCQIAFGKIDIKYCKGISFVGCNFMAHVPQTLQNNTTILFTSCVFAEDSDSEDSPVVASDNTAIVYTGCYTLAGNAYDPTA